MSARADMQTRSEVEIVTFGRRLNGWEREVMGDLAVKQMGL